MGDTNDSNPIGNVKGNRKRSGLSIIATSGPAKAVQRKAIGENIGLKSADPRKSAIKSVEPISHPPFIVAYAQHHPPTLRIIDSPSEITTAARKRRIRFPRFRRREYLTASVANIHSATAQKQKTAAKKAKKLTDPFVIPVISSQSCRCRSSRYSFRPLNINAPFYVLEVNAHIVAYFPPQVKREICKCQISRYQIRHKSSAKLANIKSGAPYPPAAGRVPPAGRPLRIRVILLERTIALPSLRRAIH